MAIVHHAIFFRGTKRHVIIQLEKGYHMVYVSPHIKVAKIIPIFHK